MLEVCEKRESYAQSKTRISKDFSASMMCLTQNNSISQKIKHIIGHDLTS